MCALRSTLLSIGPPAHGLATDAYSWRRVLALYDGRDGRALALQTSCGLWITASTGKADFYGHFECAFSVKKRHDAPSLVCLRVEQGSGANVS